MAFKIGPSWQGSAYLGGKRVRKNFSTKGEAEVFEAACSVRSVRLRSVELTDVKFKRMPAREKPARPLEIAEAYRGERLVGPVFQAAAKISWRGTKNESHALRLTDELIRRFGLLTPITEITTAKVQDLVEELIDDGNANSTINRKLSALSKLMTYAFDRRLIDKRPKIVQLKHYNNRIRYLTRYEEAAIIDGMPDDMRHFCNFLLYTGCRRGEALSLEWRDVRPDRVTFWKTKGDKSRTIPLVGKAKEAIEAMRSDASNRQSGPFEWAKKRTIRTQWDKGKYRAGLEGDEQVVPHVLRHTCATRLLASGANIVRVKEWLGHSSIEQTMRYAHLEPESLFKVADGLVKEEPIEWPVLD